MKLALVIPGFQSAPNDWCIPVFTNLARELSNHVELHVFALRYPARRERYSIGSVIIHASGGGALVGRRVPGVSLLNLWRSFLLDVRREHKSSPFSAVMGIWATEAGWLATRAANLLEVPSLVHLAGGELVNIPQIGYGNHGRGLSGRLVSGTLRTADLLTVPSSPMRKALWGQVGISPERVRAWAPGVDTEMFAPPQQNHTTVNPADNTFTFANVGSLIPVKGQELLIRAVARARAIAPEIDIRLRIAGDGALYSMLSNLILDLGLEGYVTLEGDIPHDRLPHLYNCCDAFILGSWHESQCMAALEAMACGLPWVAPPVGAIADVSAGSSGDSGIVFDRRDPDLVAQAMIRLATKSLVELQELGKNARTIVQEKYGMERQTDALLEILDELTVR